MIRIYELYVDTYFLENLVMDAAMLLLVLSLMKKQLVMRRILFAATCGATVTTFLLVFRIPSGLHYAAITLLLGLWLMRISMKEKNLQDMILGTVYFYTLAFVFTKLFQTGMLWWRNTSHGMIIALFSIAIMAVATGYMLYQKKTNESEQVYKVDILEQGKRIEVQALFDTGNALREPFSGKPVSVIEKEQVKEIWEEKTPEKYRLIPFHSIGKEHGVMRGMEVEEIIIWKGDRKIILHKAVIALYEGKLSRDDRFQMILHQGSLG